MLSVPVNLAERSYSIHVASDSAVDLGAFARERSKGSQAFLITDENVLRHAPPLEASLSQSGFQIKTITLPPGEEQKALAVASRLYDELAQAKADRKALVVALGGGVIGDLAGFVAATWNRGISLLMVPTTLLALVDSSVGGQVGINHPRGKNLIGAFHQPLGVWIDTTYLETLPTRELHSGLAEVVKYGMILDEDFFCYLEENLDRIVNREVETIQHIVAQSCRLKARVVQEDERETKGLRVVLNYGHTFAHAFETIGGYGQWLHGEAVSAGMMCAAHLAAERGMIATEVVERQKQLLTKLSLPTSTPDWPIDELLEVMRRDKKNVAGRIRLVLPTRIGEVQLLDDVEESLVRAVLEQAQLA